jgi:hypothetical protein
MRNATPILIQTLIMVGCATADPSSEEWGLDDDDGVATVAVAPTHDPELCPGGGTGGDGGEPGGGPGDQPERKRCLPSNPDDICLDCCWYNHDHVDGWKCRRIKNEKKRRACWERANETLAKCQREDCDRYGPITTIQAGDDVDR